MNRRLFVVALAVAAAPSAWPAGSARPSDLQRFWPQWRGPLGSGVAPHARPPLTWSEGQNVRWKVEVPGQGSSTPVVWGDLLFVTAAVPAGGPRSSPTPEVASPPRAPADPASPPARRLPTVAPEGPLAFRVLAYEREGGKLRWATTVREEIPHEGTHKDGSFAAASPVTDGERVYAFFGSRGLYALDMAGKTVWEKDLGDMTIKLGFGEAASPALFGDRLVVNWDHEGESFIAAFDSRTGREVWRAPREERTTWATPVIVPHGGTAHVVTSATNRVRAYDLANGRLLWEAPGLTQNAIPTPVTDGGVLYLTSGFRGNALFALKLAEAKGDVTGTSAILWRYDQDTPYVPSPLLYAGGLYFLKSNSAILTRLDAATGAKQFSARLEGLENVYASPVAADGRVYVAGREGATAVLQAGPELKVLAVNRLEDGFDASPALVDGDVFLRGRRHLYRIGAAGPR